VKRYLISGFQGGTVIEVQDHRHTGLLAESPRHQISRADGNNAWRVGIQADETFFLGGVEPSGPQRGRGEVMNMLRLVGTRETAGNSGQRKWLR
jgi:hypothetical protein